MSVIDGDASGLAICEVSLILGTTAVASGGVTAIGAAGVIQYNTVTLTRTINVRESTLTNRILNVQVYAFNGEVDANTCHLESNNVLFSGVLSGPVTQIQVIDEWVPSS
jgi:hypothetical protein